jgi:hypothetical protein
VPRSTSLHDRADGVARTPRAASRHRRRFASWPKYQSIIAIGYVDREGARRTTGANEVKDFVSLTVIDCH